MPASGGAHAKITAMKRSKDMTLERLALLSGCIDSTGKPTPKTCKKYAIVERERPFSAWLRKAAATAGRPLVAISHLTAQGIQSLAELSKKVPIVGPGLHGVFTIAAGPFKFTDAVLSGERIDKAVLADLKDKISGIQEVAPYAQTVISFVPAVGPGINGAIAAGSALLQGQSITEAVKAGVENALPGGPAAKAIFKLTVSAVSGENVITAAGNAALDALGAEGIAKDAIVSGLNTVYRVSKGDNVALAALEQSRNLLPTEELKKGFDVAVAVGHGKRLQDIAKEQLTSIGEEQLSKLKKAGEGIITSTPVFQGGKALLAKGEQAGYAIGIGLMSHSGVTPDAIQAFSMALPEEQKHGFSLAVSAHIGGVMAKPAKPKMAVEEKAGYYITQGMSGADTTNKTVMLKTVVKSTAAYQGAIVATKVMRDEAREAEDETWLDWAWKKTKQFVNEVF